MQGNLLAKWYLVAKIIGSKMLQCNEGNLLGGKNNWISPTERLVPSKVWLRFLILTQQSQISDLPFG